MSRSRPDHHIGIASLIVASGLAGLASLVANANPRAPLPTPVTASPAAAEKPAAAALGAPSGRAVTVAEPPAAIYRRECGDCHLAYPTHLLPAADWRRIVASLDRHFGVDATLEPAEVSAIVGWLESGAGRPRGRVSTGAAESSALPRISTSAWFRHEHDEIDTATWKRAATGSPARCEACHADAAEGRFDEHAVRIPR